MAKKSYYELLKDPRWQKRRLEIMERDGFACWECQAEDVTLNVHHSYYRKDAEGPWDYPGSDLTTLCEKCHAIWETAKQDINHFTGMLPLVLQLALIKTAMCLADEFAEADEAAAINELKNRLQKTDPEKWVARESKRLDKFRGQPLWDSCDDGDQQAIAACAPKAPDVPLSVLRKREKKCIEAVASLCATGSESDIAAHIVRVVGGSLERAKRDFSNLAESGYVFKAESGEYFLHPKTAAELDNLSAAS